MSIQKLKRVVLKQAVKVGEGNAILPLSAYESGRDGIELSIDLSAGLVTVTRWPWQPLPAAQPDADGKVEMRTPAGGRALGRVYVPLSGCHNFVVDEPLPVYTAVESTTKGGKGARAQAAVTSPAEANVG